MNLSVCCHEAWFFDEYWFVICSLNRDALQKMLLLQNSLLISLLFISLVCSIYSTMVKQGCWCTKCLQKFEQVTRNYSDSEPSTNFLMHALIHTNTHLKMDNCVHKSHVTGPAKNWVNRYKLQWLYSAACVLLPNNL